MASTWDVVVRLSDHTLGHASTVAGVTLGAAIVEKHFIDSRSYPGPDSASSLEPHEFRTLVDTVREAEAALGGVRYGPTERERASLVFRRSLFVVENVTEGEIFTERSVQAPRSVPESGWRRNTWT